jgi:hypothetical protein
LTTVKTIAMKNELFDDLRPYYNEEIPAAMHRISRSEHFPALAAFVYPNKTPEEVREMICAFTTIEEFQLQVMREMNEQIIARSIRRFSWEGLEGLDTDQRYLFVSNHRDIMLDSSLLQYALYRTGHRTSEITFGSNLMSSPLVVDIGKSNKMFKVMRGGNMRDFYAHSLHLSQYLHHTIKEKRESVWIAQRNGRTKDGCDATDPGIIKMFCLGAPVPPAEALASLHIVPVSIAYQWEPCDGLKALELYRSLSGKYVKQPGEDLHSILTGVLQPKGDVHIHAGTPLTENDLVPLAAEAGPLFYRQVAKLIDDQITAHYRLGCNNYIAHDLRTQTRTAAAHYTREEEALFRQHLHHLLNTAPVDNKQTLEKIFLDIYANPASLAIN